MGCYLNNFGENANDKATILILKHEAKRQEIPHYIEPDSGLIAVCVVENEMFDAAGVAFSQEEFDAFIAPDPRHKTWLTMDLDVVAKITPNVLEYIKEAKND